MTIATWTQSGRTDRPWENSFKASPTSNGGPDEEPLIPWSCCSDLYSSICNWLQCLITNLKSLQHLCYLKFIWVGVLPKWQCEEDGTYRTTEKENVSHGSWCCDKPDLFKLKCVPLPSVLTLLKSYFYWSRKKNKNLSWSAVHFYWMCIKKKSNSVVTSVGCMCAQCSNILY